MTELEKLQSNYYRLCHAVQTGVATALNFGSTEASPKHLRTGINMAMSEHGALAKLLMNKGIITELEYWQQLVAFAKREVERYEKELSEQRGVKITLL